MSIIFLQGKPSKIIKIAHPHENVEEYSEVQSSYPTLFRLSHILYYSSILTIARKDFLQMQLRPVNMKKLPKNVYLNCRKHTQHVQYRDFLANFMAEFTTWYDFWKTRINYMEVFNTSAVRRFDKYIAAILP